MFTNHDRILFSPALSADRVKKWARILLLVLGFIDLLNMPFGTILGICTIWALMNNEMVRLFAQKGASPVS